VQVAGRLRRRHRILYVAAQAIRADDAPMMILRSSAPSPFDRKVRIALSLLGFDRDVRVEAADPDNRQDSLREQNPLGKIPVLIIEDGSTVYDSLVILEYLDDRAGGGKIIPRKTGPRLAALRLQALCDGILDASILTVYEGRWRAARSTQAGKVTRGFAVCEGAPPPVLGAAIPHVGEIALASALGYRDLRFGGDFRGKYPRLVAWLEEFAVRVPAFSETTATV